MIIHEKLIQFYKGFKDGAHPMAILVRLREDNLLHIK